MKPADTGEGSGGTAPQYPEHWKRERMLFFVHEWIQEHQTGEEFVPEINVKQVARWGAEREGFNGAVAVNLFKQLVEEGYITLSFFDTQISGYPWFRAGPQSLSTKGLIEIGELPNPEERLTASLERARLAIERDTSIPESQKGDMLNTLEKMASLANNVSGLAQSIIQGLS